MRSTVIDVTRLVDRMLKGRLPTGVDRVSLAYISHFGAQARALVRFGGRWIELGSGDSRRVFDSLLAPNGMSARVLRWCVGRAYALRWQGGAERPLLINTGHSGLDDPGYARRSERRGWKPLFFLHDLIPITHPEYCRAGEAEKHRRRLATMLAAGKGLVVNSRVTRDVLEGYAAQQELMLPPCVVAPLAPAALPPAAPVSPLGQPYFVILGTIEPRKNHLLLLHLWRNLVQQFGTAAPRLLVIGQRGWECENVIDLLERCEPLRGCVSEHSCCSDGELATYLRHACALLFPSFEEGYGMPLVEALATGVPVLASALPVFREIAGDIPEYIDPLDGSAWRRMILDYAAPDSALRSAQLRRMAGYRPPTWPEHFAKVEALMEQVDAAGG
ncbi:MAG: glycosyltransferase family 4 protein [Sterolibacteriaceae bacterium]|nr:glycosyltransferase family 4 protein [Candidatus Methylophosphatis haderslevensis]